TACTEKDDEFLRQRGRIAEKFPSGLWLERNGGKLVALKVDIPKHSKKLHRYLAWVKKNEAVIVYEDGTARCNDAGELMTTWSIIPENMPSTARWYIYFGDISPKRITVPKHYRMMVGIPANGDPFEPEAA